MNAQEQAAADLLATGEPNFFVFFGAVAEFSRRERGRLGGLKAKAQGQVGRRGKTIPNLKGLKRTLAQLRTEQIDQRSALAVGVRQFKDDVRSDLGGDLTRSAEEVLEIAAREKILLDSIDAWLFRQTNLVDRRKRQVIGAVVQRTKIADSLVKKLETLGLDRKAKPIQDLASYLDEAVSEEEGDGEDGGGGAGADDAPRGSGDPPGTPGDGADDRAPLAGDEREPSDPV